MTDLLALTEHLPVVDVAAGHQLMHDGATTGSIWILVSGSMQILKDDTLVNTIDAPGAVFGEVSVLRSSPHTATVVAAEPSRLRVATDGRGLLLENPEVLLLVAAGLAERLDIVTRYLTDLRNQYAGAPGLDMVSSVLGQLSQAGQPTIQTGSRRDPDPEY